MCSLTIFFKFYLKILLILIKFYLKYLKLSEICYYRYSSNLILKFLQILKSNIFLSKMFFKFSSSLLKFS